MNAITNTVEDPILRKDGGGEHLSTSESAVVRRVIGPKRGETEKQMNAKAWQTKAVPKVRRREHSYGYKTC